MCLIFNGCIMCIYGNFKINLIQQPYQQLLLAHLRKLIVSWNAFIHRQLNFLYSENVQSLILSSDSDLHYYNTSSKANIAIDYCRLSKSQNRHIIILQKIFYKLKYLIDKYSSKDFHNKLYINGF